MFKQNPDQNCLISILFCLYPFTCLYLLLRDSVLHSIFSFYFLVKSYRNMKSPIIDILFTLLLFNENYNATNWIAFQLLNILFIDNFFVYMNQNKKSKYCCWAEFVYAKGMRKMQKTLPINRCAFPFLFSIQQFLTSWARNYFLLHLNPCLFKSVIYRQHFFLPFFCSVIF